MKTRPEVVLGPLNGQDASKLLTVRISRTDPARPVPDRRLLRRERRRRPLLGAVLIAAVLLGGCGDPEFRYVSNASINTYLKVPSDWKAYTHDDLVGAELDAARLANQPTSLIDVLVNREFQWRMAFDGDPDPSVEHTLSLAEEPVVEVSVRSLDPDERDQVSLAALRNVIVNYDELKQQAASDIASRSVGIEGPHADLHHRLLGQAEGVLDRGLGVAVERHPPLELPVDQDVDQRGGLVGLPSGVELGVDEVVVLELLPVRRHLQVGVEGGVAHVAELRLPAPGEDDQGEQDRAECGPPPLSPRSPAGDRACRAGAGGSHGFKLTGVRAAQPSGRRLRRLFMPL